MLCLADRIITLFGGNLMRKEEEKKPHCLVTVNLDFRMYDIHLYSVKLVSWTDFWHICPCYTILVYLETGGAAKNMGEGEWV